MMDNIKIDRINALAHKQKSVGLTEEEKEKMRILSDKELDEFLIKRYDLKI